MLLLLFFFVVVYSNKDNNSRSYKGRRYYLPKGVIRNYVTIDSKNLYDQAIDSDIKPYKEIRKLTTCQGDDYSTGCLLDCQIMITLKIISD